MFGKQDEVGTDHAQEITDTISSKDVQSLSDTLGELDENTDHEEVKGPDTDVWGHDHERPTMSGPPPDGINVKGPNPDVWLR